MNIDTNQFILQNQTPAGHWVDFHYRCIRLRAVKMTLFQISHISICRKYDFTWIKPMYWKPTSVMLNHISTNLLTYVRDCFAIKMNAIIALRNYG